MRKRALSRLLAALVAVPAALAVGAATAPPASAAPAPAAPADAVYGCPSGSVTYLPYPDNARKVVYCEFGSAYVTNCPSGYYWNPRVTACDIPGDIRPYETRTATGTGRVVPAPRQVKGVNARLTWRDGRPLGGATLTFSTTTGVRLCSARTDANGYAVCDSAPGLSVPLETLLNGFEAAYQGIRSLSASRAHGAVSLGG